MCSEFALIESVLSRKILQTDTYHFQNFQHVVPTGVQQATDDIRKS